MRETMNGCKRMGLGLVCLATLTLLQPPALQADQLYALAWRGTKYVSVDGRIVAQPFTENMFVKKIATDYGLSASDLVLVYRPEKRDISMMRRSTGAFVGSIIQMEYVYTDVSNTNGSATIRQTFLFDEYHDSAIGSAVGSERLQRNSAGGISAYSFSGRFNYSYPDQGALFIGSFTTGKKIVDRTGAP